jgi:ribonuclease P protein component
VLPAAARLRRRADFTAVVRGGFRAGGPVLVVHLSPPAPTASPAASTTAGFVVSRAVGPAVVRNRVRRRLRHLTRAHLGRLPVGAALVVRALPAAASASSAELDRQLGDGLGTALARSAR